MSDENGNGRMVHIPHWSRDTENTRNIRSGRPTTSANLSLKLTDEFFLKTYMRNLGANLPTFRSLGDYEFLRVHREKIEQWRNAKKSVVSSICNNISVVQKIANA